jgi:molybdate transport system regulatory protein
MAGPKGSKYYDIFLKNKVWLESVTGEEIVSKDVFKLLQIISETNSLKAAAEKIGISYRKAWGDLKEAEEKLGFFLVEKTRGGEYGGQSHLTENGKDLLDAYNELVKDIDFSIKKVTKKFFHHINK